MPRIIIFSNKKSKESIISEFQLDSLEHNFEVLVIGCFKNHQSQTLENVSFISVNSRIRGLFKKIFWGDIINICYSEEALNALGEKPDIVVFDQLISTEHLIKICSELKIPSILYLSDKFTRIDKEKQEGHVKSEKNGLVKLDLATLDTATWVMANQAVIKQFSSAGLSDKEREMFILSESFDWKIVSTPLFALG